jgi:hypothetical protein
MVTPAAAAAAAATIKLTRARGLIARDDTGAPAPAQQRLTRNSAIR